MLHHWKARLYEDSETFFYSVNIIISTTLSTINAINIPQNVLSKSANISIIAWAFSTTTLKEPDFDWEDVVPSPFQSIQRKEQTQARSQSEQNRMVKSDHDNKKIEEIWFTVLFTDFNAVVAS